MYLKSIEIQGFKSFASKAVLEFHDGITGIVGPNGSGKSNIADAVRWVLGEQKHSQLRSSGTQDVIFSGTESRRPLSFAYVAITFDNTDGFFGTEFSEVTVARRVYRSGESEYLLNGAPCRLKDIHELFYDTGIGQEGYSIIGQGQIDKILSGRPEERRELFDEAAGIVKFRRRRQMTFKKLESEHQNLLRVTDVMKELEGRIGPLSSQSEKARAFLKKREELKNSEAGVFLHETDRAERELASVAEKTKIAQDQMGELKSSMERILSRYEDLDRQITENDAEIARLQAGIGECDVSREKAEGRIEVLREQIRGIEQGESRVKDRLEEIEAGMDARRETLEQYSEEKARTDARMAEAAEELRDLADAQKLLSGSVDELEKKTEKGREELLKILDARAAAEKEQQRLSTLIGQSGIRESQLLQELIREQSSEKDAGGRLAQREADLGRLERQIGELTAKQAEAEKKRRKWGEQAAELSERIDALRAQYHREASSLESLRNIAERYDGCGNAIRRVMELKGEVPGIRGVTADLIRVDRRCETAIETALGGSIQNVVTDDEDTAKRLISYLKKNRCGRVTFLPLSAVKPPVNVPAKKALGEKGVVGMADELVETDEIYRGVVGHLLGRVLVVDNVDNALAIARKYGYSLRIVTLEGESLLPGGSIAGGAFKNGSNLLGRSREIEALEKKVSELSKKERSLRERLSEVRTADELLKDDEEELRSTLQDLNLRRNTLKVEAEHLIGEQKQREEFYAGVRGELKSLAGEKEGLKAELELADLEIECLTGREKEARKAGERQSGELSALRTEAEELQEKVSAANVRLAELKQQSDFSAENISRVEDEVGELRNSQREVLGSASKSAENIRRREEEIASLAEAAENAASNREELAGQLEGCIAEKDRMTADHRDFFDRREEMSKERSRLDMELFRLGEQAEKLERLREERIEYIWQEYGLTPHEAEELKGEETPGVTELKKRISALRREIKELGPVNVNSIEEYREVSERYGLYKTQYEDITEGEKALTGIIADLDEGMRRQFSEKFAELKDEFDRTFVQLFGGGKGTLELFTDGEHDILECGIGINAQPPGKKLQNMLQLSGGEKALTAIALLFAIQNLKPSPFCLLDEIEAALDDSNVVRFANYLQRLSKNTQFIVITHRRGTMNAADRLYGVTMQEKGVTALVSVNLVEKELD